MDIFLYFCKSFEKNALISLNFFLEYLIFRVEPMEFSKKETFLIDVFPISIAKFISIPQKKYFHNDYVILYVRKDHLEHL